MEDSEIIKLFFDRNERAITEVSAKYQRLCIGIAENVLGNEQDAEECVNDSMLVLWNLIPPNSPTKFCSYLCKIVRNQALKRYEYNTAQKRNSEFVQSVEELESVLGDGKDCYEQETDSEHLGKLINDFLHGEKDEIRSVFIRRYWFFDTVSDISKRFGFSESKVKSMLFHSRERLKVFLQKEGYNL